MSAPAPAKKFDIWDGRIQELARLHRDLERRAFGLPVFSIAPILIYFWNAVKFELFMVLDLILLLPVLLPMYLVVFIRNRFAEEKWRYRSFSKPYFGYLIRWIWRGETPASGGVVMRRLVITSLNLHFRARFQLLRRRMILEECLTPPERDQLASALDRVLDELGGRGIPGWYAYILPAASFLLSASEVFNSGPSSLATQVLGFTLLGASFSFVISTLIVKRGLMLGGSGRASYFPGGIPGSGAYATERQIFDPIGVAAQETPVDIFAVVLTFSLQTLIPKSVFAFYQKLDAAFGLPAQSQTDYVKILLFSLGVQVCLCGLAYYRRTRLCRL